MIPILLSECLKIKRKMIVFLIFLGPVGVIALEALNFEIRYDWLTKLYKTDLWKGLIGEVMSLATTTLLIGLTIIISMIANIEHQTNAWKQLLSLPISKSKMFTGKFLLTIGLLLGSCTMLAIGTIILGIILKFGTNVPYSYLLKVCYYPLLASMPFIALQIWLSITIKNQAIPIIIGIISMIICISSSTYPDWMPWKWPLLMNRWGRPIYCALFGLTFGILLHTISLIDFNRKDVK